MSLVRTTYATKPTFVDGSDATNVPWKMPTELVTSVKKTLQEKIAVGYNNGLGSKGNYPSGQDLYLVRESTTRGFSGTGRIDQWVPDSDGVYISNFAIPSRMDLYC